MHKYPVNDPYLHTIKSAKAFILYSYFCDLLSSVKDDSRFIELENNYQALCEGLKEEVDAFNAENYRQAREHIVSRVSHRYIEGISPAVRLTNKINWNTCQRNIASVSETMQVSSTEAATLYKIQELIEEPGDLVSKAWTYVLSTYAPPCVKHV